VTQKQGLPTQLRDHYLQTLGIVQYVSKDLADEVVVDNSLASVTDNPLNDSSKTQSTAVAAEVKSSQQSEITDLLQNDIETTLSKKSVKQVARTDEETSALALKFVFWQPTDQLLIATTTDEQLPDGQQVNLLARIVTAIDNQSSGLPEFDVVNWPPHPSMQGGEQEAREFIATLIKSRLAAKSTKLLLVLGQSAENWLFSKQQRSACEQGLLPIDSEVTAIIAPSLEQMLNQPQLKRDTWQFICRYLNKNSPES
jgi:DNA polymerase III psi subunit